MKHFRMGLREGCIREGRILNRVIRVNENGWEIEADQRHVDLLIRGLSLEQAKGVNTPGEDEKPWEQEEGEEKHPDRSDREYRSLAARVNYLSLDRVDLQFACKEICRGMADPRKRHWRKLRRLGRYLKQYPRGVIQYSWQEGEEDLRVYTDSDWAGCRRTARSTSGGVMMRGTHFLRSWSTTQKNITLSSGEAELVALVKASSEAIGVCQLMADWGVDVKGQILVDSSAAIGAVRRKGNGRLRHVRVGLLRVQEIEDEGVLEYKKVAGQGNPSDICTKNVNAKTSDRHMEFAHVARESGRAKHGLTM